MEMFLSQFADIILFNTSEIRSRKTHATQDVEAIDTSSSRENFTHTDDAWHRKFGSVPFPCDATSESLWPSKVSI